MKSINFLTGIFIIILLYPDRSYSQSNFKTGYVIDIQEDTINGFIDYRNWDKTPDKIAFKSAAGLRTDYTPATLKGFSVDGEDYVSGTVTVDESPFRETELIESAEPQNRTDIVFLRVLIKGPKSLYYLKDRNRKEHFFINQDGAFVTLVFKKYLQNVDGAMFVKTSEQYKGQLIVYLQDYPLIQKKIYLTKYGIKDLTGLFNEYYKDTDKEISYQPKKEGFIWEFGLLAGMSQTKLRFTGVDYFVPLSSVDFPSSYNFTFGGFSNVVFPRTRDRLSFQCELAFISYRTRALYRDDYDINMFITKYSSIGFSYVKLNTLVKYKYPIKGIYLFADGGMSNGISVAKVNYMKVEDHVYSVTNISEYPAVRSPRSWERGFIVGLGLGLKNFSAEFRIERADGMANSPGLTSPTLRHFLIFGYKF
jgi:hypothetical protein